jgi:RNA polymerase sigma-70 factor (sigma-E family)
VKEAGVGDSARRGGPAAGVSGATVPAVATVTFEELYRSERDAMVRLALFLLDDRAAAEDVVQEAYTQVHRRWHTLRENTAAVAYLRASVVNGVRSSLRHRQVVGRKQHTQYQADAAGADYLVLLHAEHRAVLEAVRQLPDRQREVIVLRYWAGLSEEQIADTLGVSRGTVKSSASRALATVESLLKGSDHDGH